MRLASAGNACRRAQQRHSPGRVDDGGRQPAAARPRATPTVDRALLPRAPDLLGGQGQERGKQLEDDLEGDPIAGLSGLLYRLC